MNYQSNSIKLVSAFCLLLTSFVFPETYYVKTDGDDGAAGTSWETAYKTITKAVNIAIDGDVIWVKEGTYQEGDTITIPQGVSLYGGFAGTEATLEKRNISEHPTIIDGGYLYRCFYNYGTIDGFYITKGKFWIDFGGGIYNEHGIVSNCTLYTNEANSGAGIYNSYGKVTKCNFYENKCGSYGAGIYNHNGEVNDCILYSNFVYHNGGGIYNFRGMVNNCTLYSNEADEGGGIYNDLGTVNDCNIYSNEVGDRGGGIYNNRGTVKNCIIHNSKTIHYITGGGIYNYHGIVTNCTLYSNEAAEGGGIYNSSGEVQECILYSNSTSYTGRGIRNDSGTVNSCILYLNSAEEGGGIYNFQGTVTNCILYSNSAKEFGGGIYHFYGSVNNCTLYSNSAIHCGGIYINRGTIINCISWNNRNGDIARIGGEVFFSCYMEASDENDNIKGNPIFMNTSGDSSTWDFHLQNGSPCIDSGTTDTAHWKLPEMDIDGNPRPGGDGKVCMGAYESPEHYTPLLPHPRNRIYVSKSGNNTNGISWEDAYTSITTACSASDGNGQTAFES
ncbi:DUF1565 domain-containing protein [Candidatus Sumerlaeota bacterium]|nr:DUF1565 domain-containing protein [Candidatus Sumerlaeota bacterium]